MQLTLKRSMRLIVGIVCVLVPGTARAHHEAIFGPQSALVLTPDRYATAQVFTRRAGAGDERTQETTGVVGAGFAPFEKPLSFSVVVPFSAITTLGRGPTRAGLEDIVLGMRYKLELPGSRPGGHSYLVGVGAVEFPTATVDHAFLKGAPGVVGAGLYGLESGRFSVIGYGFVHRHGVYEGVRESGNVFLGGGAAWTPLDDADTGRLVSLQLGVSRETTFAEERRGVRVDDSGGWSLLAHPTIVWGLSRRVLVFALTSLPLAQRWRDAAAEDRFRIGGGALIVFGG